MPRKIARMTEPPEAPKSPELQRVTSVKQDFVRHVLPAVLSLAIFLGIGHATNNVALCWVAWGIFQCGFNIGSMLSYKRGMEDSRQIVKMVYGEEWDRNSIIGKLLRNEDQYISPQRHREIFRLAEPESKGPKE